MLHAGAHAEIIVPGSWRPTHFPAHPEKDGTVKKFVTLTLVLTWGLFLWNSGPWQDSAFGEAVTGRGCYTYGDGETFITAKHISISALPSRTFAIHVAHAPLVQE